MSWKLTCETLVPTLVVKAYVNSTLLLYAAMFRRKSFVRSTGLVDPGLFFRPLRFAFISPPLTLSSDWWGKDISWRPCPSDAQNAITLNKGSFATRDNIGWSDTLRGIETVCRWADIAALVSLRSTSLQITIKLTHTILGLSELLLYWEKWTRLEFEAW